MCIHLITTINQPIVLCVFIVVPPNCSYSSSPLIKLPIHCVRTNYSLTESASRIDMMTAWWQVHKPHRPPSATGTSGVYAIRHYMWPHCSENWPKNIRICGPSSKTFCVQKLCRLHSYRIMKSIGLFVRVRCLGRELCCSASWFIESHK